MKGTINYHNDDGTIRTSEAWDGPRRELRKLLRACTDSVAPSFDRDSAELEQIAEKRNRRKRQEAELQPSVEAVVCPVCGHEWHGDVGAKCPKCNPPAIGMPR